MEVEGSRGTKWKGGEVEWYQSGKGGDARYHVEMEGK